MVGLAGPTTRRSYRELSGRGWAVGALLRPTAVPHLGPKPSTVVDQYIALELPELHAPMVTAMSSTAREDVRRSNAVAAFTSWLVATLPPPGPEGLLANTMADVIDEDPTIVRVADLAARLAVSIRTLQRVAHRYVGLTPAAMIRRRRLQHAAEQLRLHPDANIATIAADLGYADHAHLSTDFQTVLGFTPSNYRRSAR